MAMPVSYFSGRLSSYTVGRDSVCSLVLDGPFVSRRHLSFLSVTCDVARISVSGKNGAEVNGIKVNKGYTGYVRAGDSIKVGEYMIVWTGEDIKGGVFCRAAKRHPGADTTPFEIEGPPPRKAPEKPSVMLAAGPALTMAIPILLGAGRSVAVLSSVFAFMWAAANVMFRIRKQRSEEKRRRNIYTAYLEERVNMLKERITMAASALSSMYPAIGAFFAAGGDPMLIWNADPEDGTYPVRVGTGTVKNPVPIVVPKERFAGIDDSLKELPGRIRDKYASIPGAPVCIPLDDKAFNTFVIDSDRDVRMLSSFILQIASSYSPEEVSFMTDLGEDMKEKIKWITYLPHYIKDGRERENVLLTVSVTDNVNSGYRFLARGHRVILAAYGLSDLPAGMSDVINRNRDSLHISYDMADADLCFSYASSLSRLWTRDMTSSGVPSGVSFSEIIDIPASAGDTASKEAALCRSICSYYERCDVTAFFGAPIGMAAGRRKVILDLNEKAAGPHGLIAGTTGSGKSELLSTMILSFAVRYPADKLGFFLVDYKGGGMSNLFAHLPHLLGSISNLSRTEAERAMKALRSENLRRQRIFAEHHVNNIGDYTRLYDEKKADIPLPHLLLIIDEFAELKREAPSFMDSLISVSQVGRSLGIHLILATQKPAGVIDDKIRGNSRFRIALRLVEKNDSTDLIGRSDACAIKECGRAYLQVGNDEEYVCFQSAYAMGPVSEKSRIRIFTDPFCDKEIIREQPYTGPERSWYELTMSAIDLADKSMDIKKPDPLWLPQLADSIEDDSAFAVFDNVYMQSYEKAVYDPEKMGHILIMGRSGAGKSTMLLSIISHMDDGTSFYAIDLGGGELGKLSGHPFCGGVACADDTADIIRMTGFVSDIVNDRKKMRGSCGMEPERLILLIDDIVAAKKAADDEFSEHIATILTFGKAVNVYVIATTLGTGAVKEEKLFDTFFFLGNEDIYSVASMLRVTSSAVPVALDIPGRGVGLWDKTALEFMTVRPKVQTDRAPPKKRAVPFPHVPRRPCLDDLLERAKISHHEGIPVGFEEKSGKLYRIMPGRICCFLIAGKPYSGRHTLLFNISLIAPSYGMNIVRADTYEAFICAARDSDEKTMIMTVSIEGLLGDFYEKAHSSEEEEEFASYLKNPPPGQRIKTRRPMVVGVIENEVPARWAGRKIYGSLAEHPFGIVMGGCLDEARIFDWKYLPYSLLQKPLKRCVGAAYYPEEKTGKIDVIIPEVINVDNLQSL